MIRLVIPSLFEPHMLQVLDGTCKQQHELLQQGLKKADQQAWTGDSVYAWHYSVADELRYATPYMLQADSIPTNAQQYSLRADPVILEATHNGIVCRGNAILHLDISERSEIETLLNEHFSEQGLHFQLQSPSHGYVQSDKLTQATFKPLPEVLGQDISHYLPSGDDGRYWQQVLMEIQMLLHRADCNERRREVGEKTIDGLWLWGNQELPSTQPKPVAADNFYTNHKELAQIYNSQLSAKDIPDIDVLLGQQGTTEILIAQLEEACIQNDITTWQSQFSQIFTSYLQPALAAVASGKIKRLELVSEHVSYVLKPWHRWRFWL
ncbi:MAG: hypothetical protein HKP09_06455 [Enterobacterales bacterium]|nr:hypothetical protein [Enterobacterales bacterium]